MQKKTLVTIIAVAAIAVIAACAIVMMTNNSDQSDHMKITDKTFETEDGKEYPVYTGDVKIVSALGDIPYYYSDGYFAQDSKIYSDSLATFAFLLAINGFVFGAEPENQSDNIREFLGQLGCTDFYVNQSFKEEPTEDSIGVAIATINRTIDGRDVSIITVVLRSGGYGLEWSSNFNVGQGTGESAGFSSAAGQVFDELQKYMTDHKIDPESSDVKFLMTGYSRGAATINLAAKKVVDAFDNKGERTYAYTFATPAGGTTSELVEGNDYTCIHNIYDRRDLVPAVAPSDFGFFHYGVDHFLPGNEAGSITSYTMKAEGALDVDEITQLIDNYDGWEVDIKTYGEYGRMCFLLEGLFGLEDPDTFETALLTLEGNLINKQTEQESLYVRELFHNVATWAGMNRQAYADGEASFQGCVQQVIRSEQSLLLITSAVVSLFEEATPIIEENKDDPQPAIDYVLTECEKPLVLELVGFSDEQYEYFISHLMKIYYADMESNDWQGAKIAGTILNSGLDLVKYHIPFYMPCWLMAYDPMYEDFVPQKDY